MPFWRRALITFAAIVVASYVVTAFLEQVLGVVLPAYLAGVVGGIAGVPVWELLGRVGPKSGRTD